MHKFAAMTIASLLKGLILEGKSRVPLDLPGSAPDSTRYVKCVLASQCICIYEKDREKTAFTIHDWTTKEYLNLK